ncbi:MAG: beta-galactosidase [Armatimonadia bacterium]
MLNRRICLPWLAALLFLAPAMAQDTASQWVWYPEQPASDAVRETRWFRKTFDLAEPPREASLWLLVDDNHQLWVNGQGPLTPAEAIEGTQRYDLTAVLAQGKNVLAISAYNGGGPAGVIARLIVKYGDGREVIINSDASWRSAKAEEPAWTTVTFDDSKWQPVRLIGGAFTQPWYDIPRFHMNPFITAEEMAALERERAKILASPEQLATEKPARAEIRQHNGAPALFINGKPEPLVMYRGTVDPFSPYGRKLLGEFRDAGIHAYAPYVTLDRCWTGPGKYNFRLLDDIVRAYLSVDPDAHLTMLVRLVPPSWWFESHPDEMVGYATSDKIDSNDESDRVLRPSPASEAWRKESGEAWAALIRHIEAQPWGKRVIGWHACYGIYAEWHYFGSWSQQYPDTGLAMTKTFRAYLRNQYGDVKKLQAAWQDPQVTFDTAAVPGVEPRKLATLGAFRDPKQEQRVIDYYRCQHKVIADDIEYFGKLAKQETRGRAIYGIYYGYFMGVYPQAQGGHLELARLLKSPYIDYFVAPYEYGNRLMGEDGRLRSLAEAFNLAGKAHIIEADTRTYLHPREEHGRTQNLTESLAAIRREFSTGLTEHTGYWYVDFGPESVGGWYDSPEIMATIKDLYGVAKRAVDVPARRVSEVALICDLQSAYYLSDGEGLASAYKLIMDTTRQLYRLGTPFDAILLPQLPQADLSRYKVLVFLNTTAMTDEQAAYVRKLREEGKHAMVFLWAPGLTGPDGVSVARAEKITGMKLENTGVHAPGAMVVTKPDHPLTRGLPATAAASLEVTGSAPVTGFDKLETWNNPRTALYMEQHYQGYEIKPTEAGVNWTFETSDTWSDLHWQGELSPVDGIGLDASISAASPQANLKVVIKDANLAEFVTPVETFADAKLKTLAYPRAAFDNAPWSKSKPERPALPLRGMKFVVGGVNGIGPMTVQLRNLRALTGTVKTTPVCRFGDGTFGPLVTPLPQPGVEVLGHIEGRQDGLLATSGRGLQTVLYCPVPYLPAEVLMGVLAEAGVHRYTTNPADVLRADSRFMALHTKEGGARTLSLPKPATLRDAISGQTIGQGQRIEVTLPPNSTSIYEMLQTR